MRKLLIILTVALLSFSVYAGEDRDAAVADTLTASRVFTDLPISVLDLVDRSRRLDMLDYYAADSIAKIQNAMGGVSYLDTVTPDYVKVVLTPVSTLGIKVLHGRNGNVIMTAYTVGDKDQAYDTDLRFFDSSFNELKRDRFIRLPSLDDFFNYKDKESRKLVATLVPFPTVRYEPEAGGDLMDARLTVGQFMSGEDLAKIKPCLRHKIIYRWNGTKFNLEKQAK